MASLVLVTALLLPIRNQLVAFRTVFVQHLPRRLSPTDRQPLDFLFPPLFGRLERVGDELRIDQAHLHQHRGLVPVDVFVDQLAAPHAHHAHQHDLYLFLRGRDAGQYPRYLGRVREPDKHLVHDPVDSHGPTEQPHRQVGRVVVHEEFFVEAVEFFVPDPSRHGGDVVHVRPLGLSHHGGHGLIRVPVRELEPRVVVPERLEVGPAHVKGLAEQPQRARPRERGGDPVELVEVVLGEPGASVGVAVRRVTGAELL